MCVCFVVVVIKAACDNDLEMGHDGLNGLGRKLKRHKHRTSLLILSVGQIESGQIFDKYLQRCQTLFGFSRRLRCGLSRNWPLDQEDLFWTWVVSKKPATFQALTRNTRFLIGKPKTFSVSKPRILICVFVLCVSVVCTVLHDAMLQPAIQSDNRFILGELLISFGCVLGGMVLQ